MLGITSFEVWKGFSFGQAGISFLALLLTGRHNNTYHLDLHNHSGTRGFAFSTNSTQVLTRGIFLPCPGNRVKCDGDEQEIGHNLCKIYEMWLGSRILPHLLVLWRVWLLPSQSPIANTINRVNECDKLFLLHLLVDDATWKGLVTLITKGTVGSGNLVCFVKCTRP